MTVTENGTVDGKTEIGTVRTIKVKGGKIMFKQTVKGLLILSCCVFLALSATAAWGSPIGKKPKTPKYRVEFKRHLSVHETVAFLKEESLQPFSITFSGKGYSCGGLISSPQEIENLTKKLEKGLAEQLNEEELDFQYKTAVKEYLQEVKNDGFKVREIECLGEPKEELKKKEFVLRVVSD